MILQGMCGCNDYSDLCPRSQELLEIAVGLGTGFSGELHWEILGTEDCVPGLPLSHKSPAARGFAGHIVRVPCAEEGPCFHVPLLSHVTSLTGRGQADHDLKCASVQVGVSSFS